jgi:protoporphyrinogen oxidase
MRRHRQRPLPLRRGGKWTRPSRRTAEVKVEFLILGAGPTGIGAAHHLMQRGEEFLLVDSERIPGGLAKSVVDSNGFTWDMGGHIQFSHYPIFDEFMDRALGPEGWLGHVRQSWIWIAGRFIPYPLQNNVHRLPERERRICIDGVRRVSADRSRRPDNFLTWIDQTFGDGIAQLFMIPYNLKVWANPLELMSYHWVGDRVAVPTLEELDQAVESMNDKVDWGPNNTFRFPRRGGTGAVWMALAAQLDSRCLRLGDGVVEINPQSRTARLASGVEVRFEHLISTAPLDRLTAIARLNCLSLATAQLRHSTTHVIGIGLAGSPPPHLRGKNWMYFPEPNCPFYRVTVFSNYSPSNVPSPDTWSLMAEVSESPFNPVDSSRLITSVVNGLQATCLISPNSTVMSRWHAALPYGYPIPTLERDQILAEVLPELERHGIYSRGRFGAWKYEVGNQDHSFMQGWECVDRICTGTGSECEPTLNHPDRVNARSRPRVAARVDGSDS